MLPYSFKEKFDDYMENLRWKRLEKKATASALALIEEAKRTDERSRKTRLNYTLDELMTDLTICHKFCREDRKSLMQAVRFVNKMVV
jgi:hypothetical protein